MSNHKTQNESYDVLEQFADDCADDIITQLAGQTAIATPLIVIFWVSAAMALFESSSCLLGILFALLGMAITWIPTMRYALDEVANLRQ